MTEDRPIIIGAGLAGLMAALHLAPQRVVLLTRAPLGEQAASAWAQGGLAAAIGNDDSTDLHLADTLAAGDGPVRAARGPQHYRSRVLRWWMTCARLGARFDRHANGTIGLGLEAGHSRRRIVHAHGRCKRPGNSAQRYCRGAGFRPCGPSWKPAAPHGCCCATGAIAGVLATGPGGPFVLRSSRVVLATGGLGGLYLHSTNPAGAIGQGLVLAARAGAALADLEFVQFHPTALDVGLDPMPLVSEAVRGEGATLIDETSLRFMAGQWPRRTGTARCGEPRRLATHAGRSSYFPRCAHGAGFAVCHAFPRHRGSLPGQAGIDPATQPIPVRPAAHYHMGGVSVDANGRSTVPGLWACGRSGQHRPARRQPPGQQFPAGSRGHRPGRGA